MNRSAKQRMQKVKMYAPVSPGIGWNAWQTTVSKYPVWKDSHLACSFWASKHTHFLTFTFIIAAALEVFKIY